MKHSDFLHPAPEKVCKFRLLKKTATLNFCAPCRIFKHFPSTDSECKRKSWLPIRSASFSLKVKPQNTQVENGYRNLPLKKNQLPAFYLYICENCDILKLISRKRSAELTVRHKAEKNQPLFIQSSCRVC